VNKHDPAYAQSLRLVMGHLVDPHDAAPIQAVMADIERIVGDGSGSHEKFVGCIVRLMQALTSAAGAFALIAFRSSDEATRVLAQMIDMEISA